MGETSDGVNILLRGENCFVRGEGALLAERTSSTKSDATVRMVTKQQQQQQHQEQDGNGGGMGGVGIGGQPGGPGVGGPIGPARTQAQVISSKRTEKLRRTDLRTELGTDGARLPL